MNELRGRIAAVETNGFVSLVDVMVGEDSFAAILLETPEDAPYLAAGREVRVMFKESEVALAKDLFGQISLRNRIHARVLGIRRGAILSEVALDYHGQALASIITTRAAERLALQEGDEVEALIKANEVTLREA